MRADSVKRIKRHCGTPRLDVPYDNAVIRAECKTLMAELLATSKFSGVWEVENAVFEYVEMFYNIERIHSALGYLAEEYVHCPS